jgi:hypothetical protein
MKPIGTILKPYRVILEWYNEIMNFELDMSYETIEHI